MPNGVNDHIRRCMRMICLRKCASGHLHTTKGGCTTQLPFLWYFKLQNEADSLGKCINLPNGVLCTFLVSFLLADAFIEGIQ